ncbi:MAG: fibronectin type III domain-containing protein [Marinilabiliaceae bacterium]|nr:fibronectin type III domain-containing protein [Marinilabiliaceae bacterium]
MNKKQLLIFALGGMFVLPTYAQKIDFDTSNKVGQLTELNYTSWVVSAGESSSLETVDADGNAITITIDANNVDDCVVNSNWGNKCSNSILLEDAAIVYGKDGTDLKKNYTDKSVTMNFSFSGLKSGVHTIQFYLNITDRGVYDNPAPLSIYANGVEVQSGIIMSKCVNAIADVTTVSTSFTAVEGETSIVSIVSKPVEGNTYSTTNIYVSAMMLDEANVADQAHTPNIGTENYHAPATNGTMTLGWTSAASAVESRVYIGEEPFTIDSDASSVEMEFLGTTTGNTYVVTGLSNLKKYYWRVDQVNAEGVVTRGENWIFRPRQVAFPGAEGYGRFANGGRGGKVVHVTNLEDNGDDINPTEGSLRYALKAVSGPRTVVFDVSGVIKLKARLTCSDSYVTIAGQTAPGKGILITNGALGVNTDGITRFIRARLGYPEDGTQNTDRGLDGLGVAGATHSIVDHCSVGWTIDEAFSSRNCKNITLQRTLISEALNVADHPNYSSGTAHGYAATIGGDTASYHHNLLVHNEGRNWSLSGGLDATGSYAGHHDVFNNVVYNWGGRATDGGTHECNFVNNFYKMGPATTKTVLLQADLEGTGSGTQEYYVSGNIRQAKNNGALTEDKSGDTYNYRCTNGQELNWTVFVSEPYFESYATIETARAAYKNVLSDAGCSQPSLDDHDLRMVNETLSGTTSTVGSKSGKAGLIDRETDDGCEGLDWYYDIDNFPWLKRTDSFDTDSDGMPDWWEAIVGSNAAQADNNNDPDGDGYTLLEDYLNWLAQPHYAIAAGETAIIDLKQLFAGYDNQPSFSIVSADEALNANIDNTSLSLTPEQMALDKLFTISVVATDADNVSTLSREINFYVTSTPDETYSEAIAINNDNDETDDNNDTGNDTPTAVDNIVLDGNAQYEVYTLGGVYVGRVSQIDNLVKGLYILHKVGDTGNSTLFVK